jgi:hypothetical protein
VTTLAVRREKRTQRSAKLHTPEDSALAAVRRTFDDFEQQLRQHAP